LYDDETARWCQWQLNFDAHYHVEAWATTRTFDGTFATIMQPLIARCTRQGRP